jgi:hypothetical protein
MKETMAIPHSLRKTVYIIMGVLMLAVIGLSFVQLWVLYTTEDIPGYGSIQGNERGWPPPDQRGAFIILSEQRNPLFHSSLISLLPTSAPGVVDEKAGAHFTPADIKSVLIQSAVIDEASQYRVYRIGEVEQDEMRYSRQPGGKVMIIEPKDGTWDPGAYIADVPSEGMFGGRTYYQFYVDPQQ